MTCTHENVLRVLDGRGATIAWLCEDCGAKTTETDVDATEDGYGIVETPIWD